MITGMFLVFSMPYVNRQPPRRCMKPPEQIRLKALLDPWLSIMGPVAIKSTISRLRSREVKELISPWLLVSQPTYSASSESIISTKHLCKPQILNVTIPCDLLIL